MEQSKAISAALVSAEAAALVLRTLPTASRTETSIPAASVELVAAVTIGAIIFTEHRHAIRTSALLALYLLLGLVIDVVKSRFYFLRPGNAALGALAVATGALRLFLLVLEEKSRRAHLLDGDMRSNASPESTSGFLNRTLFLFLTPMLVAGYQKELLPQHLLNLRLDFSSKLMYETLGKHWSSLKGKHSKYGLIIS